MAPNVVPYKGFEELKARPQSSRGDQSEDDRPDKTLKTGEMDLRSIARWSSAAIGDPLAQLAQTVLSRASMAKILIDRQSEIADQDVFNVDVRNDGNPVTNQLYSGRCWLFATTNVCRVFVARKYNLSEFQLSQSYLFFYDHVEKANWFLEQMIDLADQPLDSQVVQYILAKPQLEQDGGQYDMAVNLIQKYGLVPQSVYPESYNSSHSEEVDTLIGTKLREFGLQIRQVYQAARTLGSKQAKRAARAAKDQQLAEVYKILAICCGTPPEPNDTFLWEFRDKDKKFHSITSTPLGFVREHVGYDVSRGVPLVNDPRYPFDELMTVDRLGNVVGGRPVKYINARAEDLKRCSIAALSKNYPVWFGSDVGKACSSKEGILDVSLYHYDKVFGSTVGLSKADRLSTGDSSMDHAMVLCGVHLDSRQRPVRWRVENSWGPKACKKGFFCMTDEWMTENVFQVVVPQEFVPAKLLDLYLNSRAEIKVLPVWDSMGTLAGKMW